MAKDKEKNSKDEGLTKHKKKSSVSFVGRLSYLRRIFSSYIGSPYVRMRKWWRKAVDSSSSKFFKFFNNLSQKGNHRKETQMFKNVLRPFGGKSKSASFARAGLVAVVLLALAACGGGGGSGGGSTTPPPTTVTVDCPKAGEQQTAADDVAAKAKCSPVTATVTPATGTTGVAYAPFAGVAVTTNGKLDSTKIANGITVTVSGGGAVAGATSAVGTTGASWNPLAQFAQLNAAGQYTATCNLVDSIGRAVSCSTTFTMASISCTLPETPNTAGTSCECKAPNSLVAGVCTAPPKCDLPSVLNSANVCVSPPAATGYTWNTTMQVFVADTGVLITGANTLPAACVTVGDACWLASVANGTIKFVNSGAVMTGQNTRPIVFAFYMTSTGIWNEMPMYADVVATSAFANQSVENGGASGGAGFITNIKGSTLGAKITAPSQGCFERVWFGSGFGNNTITCPI